MGQFFDVNAHGSLLTLSGLDYHQYDWSSNLGVGGIMVSIAAFQAVDPGSIPGRRICFNFFPYAIIMGCELEGLVMAISCPWEFTH